MKIRLCILLLFVLGMFYQGIEVKADDKLQNDGYEKYNVSPNALEFLQNKEKATLIIDLFISTEAYQPNLIGIHDEV
ncbi:hypothetical protein KCG48_10055 [Proteiniclasticum sp. BAD-10]|uniref:Uncharacterized protein n=1 Tax=Proteiniclasticum sediminis TaxID=2804028 RepID=A0A941CSV8_9CLOT|nr:hypothetical protein [Proteiniclasticum sediminis]MBR0576678.1 hypothetical protein [Proteiniclasticum sediminis]